jgi:hypothetical protein
MQHNPKIVELLKHCRNKSDAAIVSTYNEIKALGLQDKLLYNRKVVLPNTGVHIDNRDGTMVSGAEALKVLDGVAAVGVDMDLLKDATAFEEPSSRVSEKAYLQKCKNDPRLPSNVVPGQVEISSVACSHFAQALNMVLESKPHDNAAICMDGKLSRAMIVGKHPLLEPVFQNGMDWWVWKAEAAVLYPTLPDVTQRALNAKFSVQQGQDAFQMFARAVLLLNNSPIEQKVQFAIKDILKGNPKCSSDIPHIVECARKYGGTLASGFADQLTTFCSAFKVPGRTVATSAWKAIADMKFCPADLCPHVMISILMSLAGAPTSNFVTAGDIKKLSNATKIKEMKECELIIKQAVHLCGTMQVPISVATKTLGNLRTSLVFKLCEKDKVKNLQTQSAGHIAALFFKEIVLHGVDQCAVNPWSEDEVTIADRATIVASPPPSKHHKADHVVGYNESGVAVGLHRQLVGSKGFEASSIVKHKPSGDAFNNFHIHS